MSLRTEVAALTDIKPGKFIAFKFYLLDFIEIHAKVDHQQTTGLSSESEVMHQIGQKLQTLGYRKNTKFLISAQ